MAASLAPPPVTVTSRAKQASVFFRLLQGQTKVVALVLPLKPSRLQVIQPSRVQMTQTIGGAFFDDFGFGVPTVQMEGHTGWFASVEGSFWSQDTGTVSPLDGPTAYQHLYEDIYLKYFELEGASTSSDPQIALELHSTYDQINWIVKPVQNFTLVRDKSNPMVFQYTVSFSMVQDNSGLIILEPNTTLTTTTQSLPRPSVTTPAASSSTPSYTSPSGTSTTTNASTVATTAAMPPISTVTSGTPTQQESAVRHTAKRVFNILPDVPDPAGTTAIYTYTVQPGDTLYGIIVSFYGTYSSSLLFQVMNFQQVEGKYTHTPNTVTSPSHIYPGQIVFLPKWITPTLE